jgi:hypothetical protein
MHGLRLNFTDGLHGHQKEVTPAPPKRDTGVTSSLAEFIERPQAGTNQRWAEV